MFLVLYGLGQFFWFGISNPGFFFIPSTAGIFAVCVFLFHIFTRPRLDFPLTFLVSISIFLTVSGTASITFLLALFLCLFKDKLFAVLPFLMPIPIAVASLIMLVSSRGFDIVTQSFIPRINIFIDLLLSSSPLPDSFGLGTATSYLVANAFGIDLPSISTESFYASLFANLGYIGALIIAMLRNFRLFFLG